MATWSHHGGYVHNTTILLQLLQPAGGNIRVCVTWPVIRKLNGFSSESFVENEIRPLSILVVAVSRRTVSVSQAPDAKLPDNPSVNV